MAEVKPAPPSVNDWVLGNPWFWMSMGLVATGFGWVWVSAFPDGGSGARVLLVGAGLLSAAAGITIRLNSARPAYLETLSPSSRKAIFCLLAIVYALLALIPTILLFLRLLGRETIPWHPASLVVVWLITVPMSAAAAWLCATARGGQKKLTEPEEASALLVLGALACVFACFALYLGHERAGDWETIRLFLAVLAFVSLLAAPLVMLPQNIRRGVISLLVVLHFGGILSAVLAVPPAPWIVTQAWIRIFRPYLEFMYLNNAYHFYSPEPGPASYLWYRIFYEDERRQIHGRWVKVPDLDDTGRPRYPVALTYQRVLALTENVSHPGTPPPDREFVRGKNGEYVMIWAPYFERRMKHTPDYKPNLGEREPALRIPFHPYVPPSQQYQPAPLSVQPILESYARHACTLPHPEHPEWRVNSVKVYRVMHMILETPFLRGVPPNDPEFYRPYYMGEYDTDGILINPNDPFLYWLLPITRDTEGRIGDYARKHAGDPNWVRLQNGTWVEWDETKNR